MNKAICFFRNAVQKRPITVMGLLCLLLPALYVQSVPSYLSDPPATGFTAAAPFVLLGLAVAVMALWGRRSFFNAGITLLGTVVAFLAGLWIDPGFLPVELGLTPPAHPAAILLILGLVVLLLVTLWLYVQKKLTVKAMAALLIAAGFLLRLCYVLYTPVSVRQHDVWHFSNGDFTEFDNRRHAEYIEYIATYLQLPEVDPVGGLSQLYHPPFHHLLAGLWLRLNTALSVPYAVACENIQLLTLFYSSAGMVIVYRLLGLLGCKGKGRLLPLMIFCFHPTLIFMAGSVNNDLLSVTLALYGIYAAVRWYHKPDLYNILTVAFGVGLSMMSKLSGGLVSIGIAVIFLAKWVQGLQKKDGSGKKIFWQFVAFGALCVPLALWWQVKNAVIYGTPLTYVPALSQNSGQYLGEYSLIQRLFGVAPESLKTLFISWMDKGASFNEYNPFLALLKTSVFGEYVHFDAASVAPAHSFGMVFSYVLFWANALLVGLSLYAGIRCVIRYRKSPVTWGFVLIWAVIFGSYLQFCFAYPQVCTQNFRYAVPTLVCGLVALGVWWKDSARWLKGLTAIAGTVFAVASVVVYTLLGLV